MLINSDTESTIELVADMQGSADPIDAANLCELLNDAQSSNKCFFLLIVLLVGQLFSPWSLPQTITIHTPCLAFSP